VAPPPSKANQFFPAAARVILQELGNALQHHTLFTQQPPKTKPSDLDRPPFLKK
jgi:hypothetical protein